MPARSCAGAPLDSFYMHAMQSARLDLAPVVALLGSVAIMVIGNGLLGTLLGVRGVLEGFDPSAIGVMMSAYFMGYVVGAWHGPALIERAGHIRTFAACAAISAATALAHPIFIDTTAWIALRLISGYCVAGMIMIVESWLNGHAGKSTRGRLLTVYGSLMMASWGASQFLLAAAPTDGFILFSLASALLSLCLVPLTLARTTSHPSEVAPVRMGLRRLYSISPLGAVGVFVSGLSMTAFWSMAPAYARGVDLRGAEISLFMAVAMFGGLVLHWPIGWLSDRYDRRRVIVATSLVTALAATVLAIIGNSNDLTRLLPFAFVLGGVGVTIYSLCVAHSNDFFEERDLLPLASSLIVLYGVGGTLGPALAGQVMSLIGPAGLFAYVAIMQVFFLGFGIHRMRQRPALPSELQEKFVAMPEATMPTTHVAVQMDPRSGDAAETVK
jgi:MFS family permease